MNVAWQPPLPTMPLPQPYRRTPGAPRRTPDSARLLKRADPSRAGQKGETSLLPATPIAQLCTTEAMLATGQDQHQNGGYLIAGHMTR